MVAQLFPSFLKDLGGGVTFWIFAGGALALFLFTLGFIPETRQKTLEQIEHEFREGDEVQHAATDQVR